MSRRDVGAQTSGVAGQPREVWRVVAQDVVEALRIPCERIGNACAKVLVLVDEASPR